MNKKLHELFSNEKTQYLSKLEYEFSIDARYWRLSKNVNVAVGEVADLLDNETAYGYLKTLAFYAETYAADHVRNINERYLYYVRTSGASKNDCYSFINFKATLDHETEWYLGTIRGFILKWHRLGYPGVSDEVASLLKSWTIKGNIKGDVVKRLDPVQGPLSDLELQAFNECAVQLFEQDKISFDEMAMALITSHTGRRPVQVSHLRVRDVLRGKNKSNGEFHLINIPKAKQSDSVFRDQFEQFAITETLYAILAAQANDTIGKIHNKLGYELQEHDKSELPLFPDLKEFGNIDSPSELRNKVINDQLHIRSSKVLNTCEKIVQKANIISERTREQLNINPRRFRYTTGTRAAREGFGVMVIAELLGHKDTQNAGVYIKNIPDHVERLDAAVGHQLARYAQAFAGVLVDKESDARRGDDLSSRIKSHGQGIGTCGSYGFCGANVPIPCYTCMHFQPWLDGPHEIVYQEMIAERERLIEITSDQQIAAINDRTIIAVADVIQRCAARRKELANG
jgi:integrase